ncbi:hypothetical protein DL766_010549 [Monosporascus sp. MC13-8B]|uniref:Pentatricopeptide repeat domain-containing protein n=1 Tax=Monosporascus cannonballus TaxID=155416 RepID=A0ABY0H4F7_9PEZI|nr:hypothetical protein DL762_005573 [Monosporascus cannonballus]RYP00133.1 hypothetical protein DL763_001062 [Monosporascus cannonballus]RYP02056.1 hypothetical protein DL766_010549 [Monosporascus sp. MC13-8B]
MSTLVGFGAVTDVPSTVVHAKAETSLRPPAQPSDPSQDPIKSLTQHGRLFGRWVALLSDSSRLAVETDFAREGPAKSWKGPLLADKLEHHGDFALWSCLLDYQTRVNGDLGAFNIWKALWGRKSLYDVDSPLAPIFWQTILEAALRVDDRMFLQGVYLYSEWMNETHGVKWPRLYSTVVTHFLRTHQHRQAIQWHLRLIPNFYPGPDAFADILKQFASEPELHRASTLQSLYISNPNRQLYDKLVPYLYARGESGLAMAWRELLIRLDDLPLLPVPVRPFLRYLRGYFPNRPLHPREEAAISNDDKLAEGGELPAISREFINRVHGGTFGISVKNYNDGLGAKWLASSWVSLDTAISTIAALGIEKIGPLSIQAIALRERNAQGVSKRLDQLQSHGISVLDSNYLRLMLQFVEIQDDELLSDLLQSDFHPDVFDDLPLLAQLLEPTIASGDWRTYRLLLAARVLITQKMARETANAVLRACFLNRNQQALFRTLDDMRAMEIGIDLAQADLIFQNLYADVRVNKFDSDNLKTEGFYLSVCRQLVSMDIPVPAACWKQLITSMGRQGLLDDLERLCIELTSLYTSSRSSRPGFIPVHIDDIPPPMKQPLLGVENLLGVYVPEDLPSTAAWHPLRLIINTDMVGYLVRWTFRATLSQPWNMRPAALSHQDRPRDFYCGRVVRLLRILRDRGLFVRRREVVAAVMPRLVELYGTDVLTKRELQRAKANNILSLAEMKTLLDQAWGGDEFLPPLEELRAEIEKRGREKTQENIRYLRQMGKRAPHLRHVL